MTLGTAPSLDDLNTLRMPAWLWDGERARVVWANKAGVAFFGCKSLFDLIDTPFDEFDPGVARIRELSRTVKRGESWQEIISFASAVSDAPFSATVHVHALADGRNGLLMLAEQDLEANTAGGTGADAGSGQLIIETLPLPVLVCDTDGAVRQANAAAREIWRGEIPAHLAALVGQDAAEGLLNRASRAGTAGTTADMRTGFGEREFRLLARRLADGDSVSGYSIVLEDITDRRALERGPALQVSPPAVVAQAPAAADGTAMPAAAKDVARSSLDQIRAAIEAAGLEEPKPVPVQRAEAAPAPSPGSGAPAPIETNQPNQRFDVNPVIRKALGGVSKPVVLYRGGKLIYANLASAKLLGHDSEDALAGRHDIAAAISALDGKSGNIELGAGTAGHLRLQVEKSTFPWNDGAMPLAVLASASVAGTQLPAATPPVAEPVATGAQPASEPSKQVEPVLTEPAEAVRDTGSAGTAAEDVEAATSAPPSLPAAGMDEMFSILDTASDGIVFLSDSGDITYMSAGAEALFGVHAASVIDTPLTGLMDKASAKTVRDYIAALGDRGLSSLFNSGREVTAQMKDGGEVPLFLTMRRVGKPLNGVPTSAFCAVLRDITQWKKTEAELREARDRAERSSKQKSEFLARMSHELRTPLNAILGFSDVMRKGEFGKLENERYEGYANDIHTSGEYLLSLVNDLLDLSKVEAGKLELNFTSVDLGAVIDNCLKLMQNEATGARVVLRKSIAERLPQVVADMRSVKQVMLNLVSNAIKFTDPGGQVIVAAKMAGNGELVVSVSDTGVGMSEEELDHALEPFNRIETAGREVHGTGLGLPLTKALVEANRARFAISSEPRKGTRVDITFPTTRVLAG